MMALGSSPTRREILAQSLALAASLHAGCRTGTSAAGLVVLCATVMRPPMEVLSAEYTRRTGLAVELRFGGSNQLLSQLALTNIGDVFVAADVSYTDRARQAGLVGSPEIITTTLPVIAIHKGRAAQVRTLKDWVDAELRVAIGDPDAAAVGRATQQVFRAIGQWETLMGHVHRAGVTLPTVAAVAGAVEMGSVDTGIIWRANQTRRRSIRLIEDECFERGRCRVAAAVCGQSLGRGGASRFVDFLASDPISRSVFKDEGFGGPS
ncbi:MAG: molybdate ABC transporter substrate-binding protein [Planctomycetota bacterium]